MAGNSFGEVFKITTFGESHGKAIGVVVDGCPAGMKLSKKDIQKDLDRRRPGQSKVTSPRREEDKVEILSGVFKGKTTGTPICMMVFNKDARSKDYSKLKNLYRPSHADYTYAEKYGIRDYRGGGRASARETLARVAAGAIAKKYLKEKVGMEFLAYVEMLGEFWIDADPTKVTSRQIESNIMRCPSKNDAKYMIKYVEQLAKAGDSIGGTIVGVVRGVPVGLGEPVFDKLHADLGKAVLSINAVKGFEIGLGFRGVYGKGSEINDEFTMKGKKIRTKTNHSGGVLGGISNGEQIDFRVAFKPVATIGKEQETVSVKGKKVKFKASGRHDPCVLPRAVPIVEAMAAITLMDHYLRNSLYSK